MSERLERFKRFRRSTRLKRFKKIKKQAENGLQSWSSENGKTAVWHYGWKLQWYLTRDRDWRYGMVWWYGLLWFGLVLLVCLVWGGVVHMTGAFIHEEISYIDYNGLSWAILERGGVMTGMDDWDGWLAWMAWMAGLDDWHGWLAYDE